MATSDNHLKKYLRFSSVGIELGLAVGVGVAVGLVLDRYFGTRPWLLLLFAFAGIGAGFLSVYRALKRLHQEMQSKDRNEQEPKF